MYWAEVPEDLTGWLVFVKLTRRVEYSTGWYKVVLYSTNEPLKYGHAAIHGSFGDTEEEAIKNYVEILNGDDDRNSHTILYPDIIIQPIRKITEQDITKFSWQELPILSEKEINTFYKKLHKDLREEGFSSHSYTNIEQISFADAQKLWDNVSPKEKEVDDTEFNRCPYFFVLERDMGKYGIVYDLVGMDRDKDFVHLLFGMGENPIKKTTKLAWNEPTRDAELPKYDGWLVKATRDLLDSYYGVIDHFDDSTVSKYIGWWASSPEEAMELFKKGGSPNFAVWANGITLELIEYVGKRKTSAAETYTDASDVNQDIFNRNTLEFHQELFPFPKDEYPGEDSQEFKTKPNVFQDIDEPLNQGYNGVQAKLVQLSWSDLSTALGFDPQNVDEIKAFILSHIDVNNSREVFHDLLKEEKNNDSRGLITYNNLLIDAFSVYDELTAEQPELHFYPHLLELKIPVPVLNTFINKWNNVFLDILSEKQNKTSFIDLPNAESISEYDIAPLNELSLYPSKRKENQDIVKYRNDKRDEEMIFEKGTHQTTDRNETFRNITPFAKLSWAAHEKKSLLDSVYGDIWRRSDKIEPFFFIIQKPVVLLKSHDGTIYVNVKGIPFRNRNDFHAQMQTNSSALTMVSLVVELDTFDWDFIGNDASSFLLARESSSKNRLFIYIKPDDELPQELNNLENVKELHTTLLYAPINIESNDRISVIKDIQEELKNYNAPTCSFTGKAKFNNDDASDVLLVNLENGATLYSSLVSIIEKYASWERKYDFIPHMTIHGTLSKIPDFKWKAQRIYIEFEKDVPAVSIDFKTGDLGEIGALGDKFAWKSVDTTDYHGFLGARPGDVWKVSYRDNSFYTVITEKPKLKSNTSDIEDTEYVIEVNGVWSRKLDVLFELKNIKATSWIFQIELYNEDVFEYLGTYEELKNGEKTRNNTTSISTERSGEGENQEKISYQENCYRASKSITETELSIISSLDEFPQEITVQDIHDMHSEVINNYNGLPGIKDDTEDKLEAAIGRMYSGFGEHEFYKTAIEKAAVLMHSIISSHPYPDGNKRTAYTAGLYFLHINGFTIEDSEDLAQLIIEIADDKAGLQDLTEFISRHKQDWKQTFSN